MSLKLSALAASPLAGLTDGSPRKSPPPAAQPRPAPATTRSIAVVEKLGQGRAGLARIPAPNPDPNTDPNTDHGSAPRPAIHRQFAPTTCTPGLRSMPVPAPASRP